MSSHDAIFFGAVGWPERFQTTYHFGVLLLKFRREFDQYINLRPVKLMPGVPSPLSGKPGDIDFLIVRENTEGDTVPLVAKCLKELRESLLSRKL